MPLVRISLAQGYAPEYYRAVADGVHQALVEHASVPVDDRFQLIERLDPGDIHWSATYLGIQRSSGVVFIQVFLNRGRSLEVKQALYAGIAASLSAAPGIRKEDVIVNLVEVSRENWSFGGGVMSYAPAP